MWIRPAGPTPRRCYPTGRAERRRRLAEPDLEFRAFCARKGLPASSTLQLERAWNAWQAGRYQRGEIGGYASTWGFAIYRASQDDYQDSFLPSGQPAGTPEEALDCACGLYLGDPTAWLTPPGADTPTDLQAGALASAATSRSGRRSTASVSCPRRRSSLAPSRCCTRRPAPVPSTVATTAPGGGSGSSAPRPPSARPAGLATQPPRPGCEPRPSALPRLPCEPALCVRSRRAGD
jgi:hypothetical protein